MLNENDSLAAVDLVHFSRHLLSVRIWEYKNIPKLVPQISLDVLLYSASRVDGAAVKEFHHALGHSQDRIREVLNHFSRQGWVEIRQSQSDGRTKRVIPTQKLISIVAEYRAALLRGVPMERSLRVKKVVRRAKAGIPEGK